MLHNTRPWLIVIGWQFLPRTVQIRRVNKRLDERVITWDRLIERIDSDDKVRRQPVVYTHVPKTGGQTLKYLLAKNYFINGVVCLNAHWVHRNPNALLKNGVFPRVAMGHYKLNQVVYRFIDRNVAHLTMIRDPVARMLSYFRYLKSSKNHALYRKVKDMDLRAFAQSMVSTELDDGQTLRLAGMLRRRPGRSRPNQPEALDMAKANLVERFSFFGVTDRYPEFLIMARRLLGWSDPFHERRNVSKPRSETELPPDDVLDVIRERNEMDLELYRFASELFDERCAALGINGETLDTFQRFNDQYTTLVQGAV